ncbi:MAG: type I methionyl aminopeptidase, partial [Deltaproteobacteria bacterium]|nr:type I methionyl aminopeptidase [Deltaproteobacteria bacterium]
VLDAMGAMIAPGVTTWEIGALGTELVREHGVEAAFLGYGSPPFPSVVCVSVNDEIVHGVPRRSRMLEEGDIVSVDFGVAKDGYFGDAARTFGVGEISSQARRLMSVTKEALERAIEQCHVGKKLSDVSKAVQKHVESCGFSVIRHFFGHGIGTDLHEDPLVPNFVERFRRAPRLKPGMVLAIEPMVVAGEPAVIVDEDGWTARTRDGKLAAHFEHSVAILEEGPWVLSEFASRSE